MSAVPFRLQWFHALLSARSAGRILEVGCGNGQLLALLAQRCPRAELVGIDRSALQVQRATARLAAASAVRVQRMTLAEAAERFAAQSFAMVVAMNVNAFWTEPAAAGEALRRLLLPRGRALLGWEPPTPRGRDALVAQVRQALPAAGLALLAEHVPRADGAAVFALSLAPAAPRRSIGRQAPRARTAR